MNKCKERILVFSLGLFFALFFLEAILQGYGIFYSLKRNYYNNAPLRKSANKYVILCLGNSFTVGAGAGKGESYSAFLQILFDNNAKEKNVVVVNRGARAMNTGGILDALTKNILEINSNIIILQAGSPNIRNLYKYELYLKRKNPALKDKNPFFKSRIFRLVAILTNSAKSKSYYDPFKQEQLTRERDKKREEDIGKSKIKRIIGNANYKLKFYNERWKEFLNKLLSVFEDIENYPYSLSVYDRRNVGQEDIYLWVESDIREIVKVARARGVKVLIHSYPLPANRMPDDILNKTFSENIRRINEIQYNVAKEERVPFVDNADLFSFQPEAVAGDFRHPNAKGYEIIAQRIYERILEENLLITIENK